MTGKKRAGEEQLEESPKKKEKASAKREKRDKRKREIEELGKDAPPAQVPRTLESMREFDETVVAADDEEIAGEEAMDEYAEYFGGNGAQRRTQSSPLARAVAWSSDATMLLLLQLRRR